MSKGSEALAWLASRENKDEDIRRQAKSILDTLYYIQQQQQNKQMKGQMK